MTSRAVKKPDMKLPDRTFVIHHFGGESQHCTRIRVQQERNRLVTYKDVLMAIGRRFFLKWESLDIFGLFLGPLGQPTKLCNNTEMVPDEVRELSFQRLSFLQEKERGIIKEDEKACELIFWEVVNYRRTMLLSIEDEADRITDADKLISKFTVSRKHGFGDVREIMIHFMGIMLSLRHYYWFTFYHANNCTLQDSMMASNMYCQKGQKVHVFLDKTVLSCLILGPGNEYIGNLNIPWSAIRFVKKNTSDQLFVIQVLTQDQYHRLRFNTISIQTEHFDYLYSIAVHIIGIQVKLLLPVDLSRPHTLAGKEVQALDSIRPPFMNDLRDFISMFLPFNFLAELFLNFLRDGGKSESPSPDETPSPIIPHTSPLETWFKKEDIPDIQVPHEQEKPWFVQEETSKLPVSPNDEVTNKEVFQNERYNSMYCKVG